MNYEIELSRSAQKYLSKLDMRTRSRIFKHLKILSDNPRSPELDIKRFQGSPNLYRLRVGTFRVLYNIQDNILLVNVIKIGSRGDVYK